jgi:hypothetical protein
MGASAVHDMAEAECPRIREASLPKWRVRGLSERPNGELTLWRCYPIKGIRVKRCQMNEVPTLVTNCLNCISPGSLSATLAVILIGTGIAWTAERRKLARVRSRK